MDHTRVINGHVYSRSWIAGTLRIPEGVQILSRPGPMLHNLGFASVVPAKCRRSPPAHQVYDLDLIEHCPNVRRWKRVLVGGADRRQLAARVRCAHLSFRSAERLPNPCGQWQSLRFGALYVPPEFVVIERDLQSPTHDGSIEDHR